MNGMPKWIDTLIFIALAAVLIGLLIGGLWAMMTQVGMI